MPKLTLLQGDALAVLKTLPNDSVHAVVTSPPYYGLRDYGVDGQIGLEPTLDAYLSRLVAVFAEVRRVLHPSGVCFVNMGDSYAGGGNNRGNGSPISAKQASNAGATGQCAEHAKNLMLDPTLKPKDRLLVPFRLALLLQADGWWVRDIICWAKRAPMPESVTDRCTQSWEPIFMLTKAARYFWDAEAVKEQSEMTPQNRFTDGRGPKDAGFRPDRCPPGMSRGQAKGWTPEPGRDYESGQSRHGNALKAEAPRGSRNLRNVWLLSPSLYPDAHFATFVPEIPKRCILAGTSAKGVCPKCGEPWVRQVEVTPPPKCERQPPRPRQAGNDSAAAMLRAKNDNWNGPELAAWKAEHPDRTVGWSPGCACGGEPVPATVLDPFAGTFTTGAVALDLGRHAIGIELSEEYVKLAERRCAAVTPGLALA